MGGRGAWERQTGLSRIGKLLALLVLICTAVGTLGAQALEERDDDSSRRIMGLPEVRVQELSIPGEVQLLRATASPTSAPTAAPEPVLDEPPEPTPATPETGPPEPILAPEEPLGGIEAAICAYPWECGIALRVAACESGPDYAAGYNGSGHAGTFQISPIHAWRFTNRGMDFWSDALVLEANLDVAFEIWTERWWWAWSCYGG